MAAESRTQVGIVGAGPAGLLLGRLLGLGGIETVVLELRSREHIEGRMRAGMLEHATVELLGEAGVAERLRRRAAFHEGFELRFDGQRHRVPMAELTGGCVAAMYPQQEVVKDLVAVRLADDGPLLFQAAGVRLAELTSGTPEIHYEHDGRAHVLRCDAVAGCDGFRGVCRGSIPEGALTVYTHRYPFAWLGVLADVAPSTHELIYAYHQNGFALHSMRSPQVSRLYLQVGPQADRADWPDRHIWDELHTRMTTDDDWTLQEGEITQRSITDMRSFVCEPMQYGNLFLAGDAAHIVPPTAAKGMNLALGDVRLLAEGLVAWLRDGDRESLDAYSKHALRGVWRAQEFSRMMTQLLHAEPGDDFKGRLQLAQLQALCGSRAAMAAFCESYLGAVPAGATVPVTS